MKLLRSELSSEFKEKLFDINAGELPHRETIFHKNKISCEISSTIVDHGFQLSGRILVSPKYECVRCLEFYSISLDLPLKIWLTEKESFSDSNEQDMVFCPANQDTIGLSETIADIISLAEPMNPLCNENCKGLCSRCGVNKNISSCDCKKEDSDNPWDALKKLDLD